MSPELLEVCKGLMINFLVLAQQIEFYASTRCLPSYFKTFFLLFYHPPAYRRRTSIQCLIFIVFLVCICTYSRRRRTYLLSLVGIIVSRNMSCLSRAGKNIKHYVDGAPVGLKLRH